MNTFDLACAVLSSTAYRTGFDPENRIQPLADATRLPGDLGYKTIGGISGFEASAFEYDGKIVIAYAGTNPSQLADLAADGAMALGITHPQLLQAAEFYEAIKNNPAYAGKEIVFTGHSLGGGLAAAMGVFFNKQAVTFDPAPLRLVATQANANEIKAYLASSHPEWLPDTDLASFTAVEGVVGLHAPTLSATIAALLAPVNSALALTIPTLAFPITIRGEGNIKTYSVSGEFLTNGYQGFASSDLNTLRIQSGSQPESIVINPTGANVGLFDLHSMNLLIAAAKEPRLATLVNQNPRLAELLFDTSVYTHKPSEGVKDFLARAIQQEFGGTASAAGTGYLGKFADDLSKLYSNTQGVAAQASMQKALTVAAMDYYYNKDATNATQFFTTTSGAIHFNLSDINATQLKSLPLLRTAASSTATGGDPFNIDNVNTASAWHVQTGAGGMNWLDSAGVNDVAIGGAQNDVLRAGAGSDYVVGGAGADILDGGSGNDALLGGTGTDTYQFSGDWGKDTIVDADGNGSLMLGGEPLTGGKKVAEHLWQSDDEITRYLLTNSGDLIVSRTDGNSTITIRGWQSSGGNQLGIVLDDAPAPETPPEGALFFNGDQRAQIIGIDQETQLNITADKPTYGTYAWGETSWAADGTLNNGVAEADFSDVINASVAGANGSVIHGWGGNDALSGSSGKDDIFGDAGDDLIGGGAGSDNIRGGDGNDYINSSATLNVYQRLRPTDSWSPPAGQLVLTQGALWGIYKDTLPDGTPVTVWSGSNDPAGVDGDVVDAGAGNDWVVASGGDDRVQGGLGNDQIDGMGGNDVLEGNDGADTMLGDGLNKTGFFNSVAAQFHGADFIDGGAGDDELTGGGGNDVVYGGADNDHLRGDYAGNTGSVDYLDLAYHGSDPGETKTHSVGRHHRQWSKARQRVRRRIMHRTGVKGAHV